MNCIVETRLVELICASNASKPPCLSAFDFRVLAMASPLLSQAITVVQQAIQHDSAGNVAQAVVYYQQALELFRQAHSVERDPNLAATILAKYQEYSARAELLRSSMQATPPAVAQPNIAPLIQQPVPPTSAYRTASHQSPLQRALELAQHADREYKHNNFVVALELYKECADIYLELLKSTMHFHFPFTFLIARLSLPALYRGEQPQSQSLISRIRPVVCQPR